MELNDDNHFHLSSAPRLLGDAGCGIQKPWCSASRRWEGGQPTNVAWIKVPGCWFLSGGTLTTPEGGSASAWR